MSDTLIWQAPPEHPSSADTGQQDLIAHRRERVASNLANLKARPGEWAIVHTGSSSTNAGEVYKVLGCEVTSRANYSLAKLTRDIYARWPEPCAEAA